MAYRDNYISLQDNHKDHEMGLIKGLQSNNFKKDLLGLFDPDHIKDHVSIRLLNQLGGIERILNTLDTSLSEGISSSSQALQERGKKWGKNLPVVTPPKSLMFFICEQFEDLMLRVLTGAAIIAVIVGILKDGIAHGWMEGVAICMAVVIVVSVGAFNNYMKEKQFAKLNSKKEERYVKVIRDGQETQVFIYDLMVGDIFDVRLGEQLPVDGILIESAGKMMIDESSMTGESDLIEKCTAYEVDHVSKNQTPFLLSGTLVMDGAGQMVVCSVGNDTQIGQLKMRLQEEKQATPLQLKLEDLANDIGKAGLCASLLTFIAMCIHLIIDIANGRIEAWSLETANQIVKFLIVAVTIIVVAIPEGLPLAVTISLAYSVGKMKEENNLVRHLQSCEIMGGADNICSDKTGTLTQNQMTVTNIFFENQQKSQDQIRPENFDKENLKYLCEGICINSDANPEYTPEQKKFKQLGNKTECALIEMAYNLGYNYKKYRTTKKGEQPLGHKERIVPFNSSLKRMLTVWKSQDKYTVFIKGASEVILEMCDTMVGPNKERIELTREKKDDINRIYIEGFAKKSLRTIGMAYAEIDIDMVDDIKNCDQEIFEKNLILLAITGIKDPLRPDVDKAIQKCYTAGIKVRMVTGDNIITAQAIAKECGILRINYDFEQRDDDDYQVLEGKRFRELVGGVIKDENADKEAGATRVQNLQKFREIAQQLKVLARSTPDDKYTLVTGLIQCGAVVAVTGDGTNDAPALKKADVGFAMGIAGTEVAKEAAGIILLDDNFSSIVTACKWGRNIFDSIRKFLQFQLTINVVACLLAFLGGVALKESPLTSIQMLWVNLIMDSFASLALATEPPSDELLQRKPYSRKEYIVTPQMMRMIVCQGIFQIVVLVTMMFFGPQLFNIPSSTGMDLWDPERGDHYTMIFHTFVMMQCWNQINCRKLKKTEYNVFRGFFNNILFLIIEIGIVIIQVVIVEYGGAFFRCSSLSLEQHLICVGIGFSGLVWGLFVKFIPDAIFQRISIFRESNIVQQDRNKMDQTITSVLRKRASSRFGEKRKSRNLSRQGSRRD